MYRAWITVVLGVCLIGGLGGVTCAAISPVVNERGAVLEFTEENDWFAGTDRHYTQGARMVLLGAEHSQPHWLKDFAAFGLRVDAWRAGFQLGQSIFTPEDLLASAPVPNDRPYAGWLYAGPVLQRRGVMTSLGVPVLETFQLQAGVIGPAAMGEEVQNSIHDILQHNEETRGWRNQLRNEPGFVLKYQRTWRVSPSGPRDWSAELLPHMGASLGNVDTSIRAGATLRAGWRMPDDFGVATMDGTGISDGGRSANAQNNRYGAYAFVRVEERYVGYNEFLDGTLFPGYERVTMRRGVGDLQGGLVLVAPRCDIAFTMTYRMLEFYGQDGEDIFGSLTLRCKF